MKSNFKNEIQTFGRSLLLPIAVLAPVGLCPLLADEVADRVPGPSPDAVNHA